MALDLRRQLKLISVPDENMKSVANNKLNVTKEPTGTRRAALRDTGNMLHSGTTSMNGLPKSKLPIPNPTLSKTKITTGPSIIKPKISDSKENRVPAAYAKVTKSSAVTSIVDKTKTLKIEPLKQKQIVTRTQLNSKDSCGVIEDIDKNDYKNIFTVAAYAKDIHSYLKHLEIVHPIHEDYLKGRSVTPRMRSILIDWLFEVQQEYQLLQETVHIAIGILDTYLQETVDVNKKHMQLIGVAALFLACKYEEILVPSVTELVYISASAFTEDDLYEMERQVFKVIKFDLSRPISLTFLRRYSKAGGAVSHQHTFAKYFLDIALLEYSLCHVKPSLVAAAALCLALFITKEKEKIDDSVWTRSLEFYSGYSLEDIKPVLKSLAKLVLSIKNSDFKAAFNKYASPKLLKASQHPILYSRTMKTLACSI